MRLLSSKSNMSTEDIKVLTVRNGEGEELKDARFVEVLKSAGKRIKSASSEGQFNLRGKHLKLDRL